MQTEQPSNLQTMDRATQSFEICNTFCLTQYVPWCLYEMVTQIMLRTHEGKYSFSGKKVRFVPPLNQIKYLKPIKLVLRMIISIILIFIKYCKKSVRDKVPYVLKDLPVFLKCMF